MLWKSSWFLPLICSLSLGLLAASCTVSLDDNKEDERESFEYESWSSNPPSSTYEYQKCEGSSSSVFRLCGTKPGNEGQNYGYNWQPNCENGECTVVSVFAHYNRGEDLGPQQTMHIEAFDNAQFSGSPSASLEIIGFDASKQGSSNREEIYLAPGEYYFRAYLAPTGNSPVPYALGGMALVTDAPVGFYGAASGATRVLVKDQDVTVHIDINQLYAKPELDSANQAFFSFELNLDPDAIIPKDRKVRIRFYDLGDIQSTQRYDFELDSNTFLVQGQEHSSNFLTPSLKTGTYYVFAFLDSNGDMRYQDSELGSFALNADGKPLAVSIAKNQTRNLSLLLTLPASSSQGTAVGNRSTSR